MKDFYRGFAAGGTVRGRRPLAPGIALSNGPKSSQPFLVTADTNGRRDTIHQTDEQHRPRSDPVPHA
ncbi:hypothetical protein MRX96_041193 [Rhipicephalus microplus]